MAGQLKLISQIVKHIWRLKKHGTSDPTVLAQSLDFVIAELERREAMAIAELKEVQAKLEEARKHKREFVAAEIRHAARGMDVLGRTPEERKRYGVRTDVS